MKELEELCERLLRGEKRAIAKLLTIVESRSPSAKTVIKEIYPHTGKAHVIGITGPPGVGKSTLIEKLIRELRAHDKTIGIVAVDPTSPFSGGAFLGDRVRMQSLSTDKGVFIRSMATRGSVGGISIATRDAVRVLDASGADIVIVETVGAGQSDVEVIKVAETVVVVLSPGAGDEIQALKAGIMEIADIFVINKADLDGADRVQVDIIRTLEMKPSVSEWTPPVLMVIAKTGEGIQELLETLKIHATLLKTAGDSHERNRIEEEIEHIVREKAAEHVVGILKGSIQLSDTVEKVLKMEADPYTAVEDLLSRAQYAPSKKKPGRLERGLVQVYTGDGKGKTSAALGLALRALGRGLTVHMVQFIKGKVDYGEGVMAKNLSGFEMVSYGKGSFIAGGTPTSEDYEQARKALDHAKEIIKADSYDIIILDEVNVAISLGLLKTQDILKLINLKPDRVELVLTGRGAPNEIVEAADLVTEMKEIKHPLSKGIKARKGIEF